MFFEMTNKTKILLRVIRNKTDKKNLPVSEMKTEILISFYKTSKKKKIKNLCINLIIYITWTSF